MADKRRDSGEWYPGGRVMARPDVAPAQVQINVSWSEIHGKPDFSEIAALGAADTLGTVKQTMNTVVNKLKTSVLIICAGMATVCAAVAPQFAALDDIPGNRQIMTNTQEYVDAKVGAVPVAGNYAVVSNAAMSAVQPDALTNAVTQGWWSEWTQTPSGPYHWQVLYSQSNGKWGYFDPSFGSVTNWTLEADANATSLTFGRIEDVIYTVTRNRIAGPVPTKTSDLANDTGYVTETITNGLVTSSITNGLVPLASLAPSVAAVVTNAVEVWSEWTFSGNANPNNLYTMTEYDIGGGLYAYVLYEDGTQIDTIGGLQGEQTSIDFPVSGITATRQRITRNALGLVTANDLAALAGAGTTPQTVTNIVRDLSIDLPSAASLATNAADHAVATADTTYLRYDALTNVNQSVQYVTNAPGGILSIAIPSGTAATKDWIVYAFFDAETELSLPGSASWWAADAAVTNAIPSNTVTVLYFTQITGDNYMLSRQELAPVGGGAQ